MPLMLPGVSGLQQAQMGKSDCTETLEKITDSPEDLNFGELVEEVTCTEEAIPCNKLPGTEKCYVQRWILLYCGKGSKVEIAFVGSPKMLKKLQKEKLNLVSVQR
ncbi:unnamed protein product [Coccothraustes coccothraustes]